MRGLGTTCWVKSQEAVSYLRRGLDLQLADKKGPTEQMAYDMRVLGQALLEQGRIPDAQAMFALGLGAIDLANQEDSKPLKLRLELIDLLAGTLEHQGEWAKPEPLLQRLHKLQTQHQQTLKTADQEVAKTLQRLAAANSAHKSGTATPGPSKQAVPVEKP